MSANANIILNSEVTQYVGTTPLVWVPSLSKRYNTNVWAKLEGCNPGLSIKDRIVKYMLDDAERQGLITPGKSTIVEASSGNTGYSLAMIGAARGYQVIITLKDKTSPEKVTMIEAMNAKVVLCPSHLESSHPDSYYAKAKHIAETTKGGFYLDQNFNEGNMLAHYYSTAPEIYQQIGARITHVLAASSTGGTISGLGKYFKEVNKDIKVLGIDCVGSTLSQYFFNGEIDPTIRRSTCLEGVGKDIIPGNFKAEYIDDMVTISDRDAIQHMLDLCGQEGIMAGGSSGAVLAALANMADQLKQGDHVVLIFPDHGSKYLSKYYSAEWRAKAGIAQLKEEAA